MDLPKGQLISKCLYEVIVWTKIPFRAEIVKIFVGILVQTMI